VLSQAEIQDKIKQLLVRLSEKLKSGFSADKKEVINKG
jgi:hypothetical protein